jgi:antitoxin component YwqK of YwqJK toxin-antitoxin module
MKCFGGGMKALIYLILPTLLMVGCVQPLFYVPNEKKSFTGLSKSTFDNGQVASLIHWKSGKIDGLATWWYENGQKKEESNWKNGKMEGLVTLWYENGQKKEESNWKDGKIISVKVWKPNGEKCPVTIVTNGNGTEVIYDENGTEESRFTFIKGEYISE